MDIRGRRHRTSITGSKGGFLIALSVVLALVVAACGSTDEPTAESTTTTAAPSGSSTTSAATETTTGGDAGDGRAESQDLTIGMGAILRNFDPASTQGINDYVAIRMVYDALTTLDNGAPEPWAAESWEAVSPTQWRFKLREGMRFTNGEPFDAEAVRYTFQRALDSADNPWRVRIEALESMTIVDDLTVEFNLSKPVGNWPSRVAIVWIVPPVYTESNDITLNPLGSGPFKVESFTPGEEVVYSANPDWWRDAPTLESVTLRAIPENATRVATLLAGDIDVAYKILPDQVPQVEDAGYVLDSVPSGFLANIFFQSSRLDEPIGDVRVRQAIDFAIDKEGIREFIAGGYGGDVQGQAVGPNSIGHNPDVTARPYDPDRARELLAEAGYADGLTIGFDYSVGRYFADKEIAEAVIGYLAAVGIIVEANPMEGGAWLDKIYTGEWGPISFWSYQDAPFYDLSITTEIFKSDGFRKITADTEIDRYIDESFSITDPQERADHLAEYGKYLVDNAYIVPLFHDPGLYAYAPNVRDIVILPSTMINLWDTYLADE
jgi:peptide/nickel transport system substrate-binding protein